jgi:AGZA family xanthine/uracil permease-like MFS transporter
MPLANSISIGLRFIAYGLIKILSGKLAEASPAVIVLAVLFAAKFALAG